MFTGKSFKKLRKVTAALGVATALLWGGATNVMAEKLFDFTGTNRTSFVTLNFATGGPITWRVTGNPAAAGANQAFRREFNYGLSDSDSVVVGDYVGTAASEPTVYRDTNSTFYVGNFPTGTGGVTLNRAQPFGNGATDIVGTPGDYDGGGKTDYCVVRVINSNLTWFIMSSETGTMKAITFGTTAGLPPPPATGVATVFPGADFTGDGRDELIYVTRNASGTMVNYFIGDANTGAGVITRSFGNYNTDVSLAPDDYTGDGRADFVAVRQTSGANAVSVWFIQNSQTNAVTATSFGIADSTFMGLGDLPVRGDYDGDNIHDICVWRSTEQNFYYIRSIAACAQTQTGGCIQAQKSGEATDFPLGSIDAY